MGQQALPFPKQAALSAAEVSTFADLTTLLDYLTATDLENVRLAYRFADEAHLGQLRKNGLPYITHPIAVAGLCAQWKLDAQAIMAALLHDAIEDCGISKSELIERFGAPVADLVDGLTKLEKLHFTTREENQAESFRKMLLAMARDVRVILIKLADRTHNMRTMGDMPRDKWGRIAQETLDIYAPIAHRLGLNKTYRELQDLCFLHLFPWRYAVLSKAVARSRHRRRDLLQKVQVDLESRFKTAGIAVRLNGREKTLHSIYRKMQNKHLSFAQVTDVYGFRVVLGTTIECYTAVGLLHQMYKPVPGKFKDYIAIPKVNGYQSLHTILVGPSGLNIEFQLRTESMNVVAESGVAAHWLYKTKHSSEATSDGLDTQWLQSLLDIQHETHDAAEFLDHVKVDLFPDGVYVFTPTSEIMSMPRGATVVDFAYAIHSNVGDRCFGARVNGEQVPLRTTLKNGDVVEVITSAVAAPNPAWLSFVRTGRARSKIRQHLKTLAHSESESLGEKLLSQALRAEGFSNKVLSDMPLSAWEKLLRFTGNKTYADLLTDIGMGRRIASMVAKRMLPLLHEVGFKADPMLLSQTRFSAEQGKSAGSVALDGSENASVQYAPCCHPIPGEAIVGYVGRGEGLVVHAQLCSVSQRLAQKDSERFIEVDWSDEPVRMFEVGLAVTVSNIKGVLAKVAATLASAEADIVHIDMGTEMPQEAKDMRLIIAVRDGVHLDAVLRALRRSAWVIKADRQRQISTLN